MDSKDTCDEFHSFSPKKCVQYPVRLRDTRTARDHRQKALTGEQTEKR